MQPAPTLFDLPFMVQAGIVLLFWGTLAAIAARRRLDALIGYGAVADAGIALIGFGLGSATATTGGILFAAFQCLARLLAYGALRPLMSKAGSAEADALRGIREAMPASAVLYGFGMFAALGISPFLVPEGRMLVTAAAVQSGGLLLPLLMALSAAIMAWLTVVATQTVCLEHGPWEASGITPERLPLHLAPVVLAVAGCGIGGHALMVGAATFLGHAPESLPALADGWHPAALVPYAGAFCVWAAGGVARPFRSILAVALAAAALALAWHGAGLDPLARLFAVITGGVCLAVTAYSVGYITHARHSSGYYFFLMIMTGSLMGLVSTRSFGSFYGFWELMTWSSYFLVVHEGTPRAFRAGVKYFVMCAAGAMFMLPGLLMLTNGGSADFDAVTTAVRQLDPILLKAALLLTLAGFAVKAGFVPVHGWLPDAHPVAPSSISGPLSGLLTKIGIYGIVRVLFAICGMTVLLQTGEGIAGISWMGAAVTTLGVLTMAYGEVMALRQDDIKRLLAYSTMGQIGEIATIIGLGTWLSTTGALAHVLNHAIMKNLLFLCAGALVMRAGRKLEDLAGMGRMMPWTAGCMMVGVLSIMGMPPFAGFASKYLMLQGAVQAGHPELAAALLLASLAGAVYYMRIIRVLVFMPRKGHPVQEAPWAMRLPMLVLAGLCVFLGIAPQYGLALVTPVADMLVAAGNLAPQTLPSLTVSWPPYVVLTMLGAALPALLRHDRKLAGWGTSLVLLVAAVVAAFTGRDLDMLSYGFVLTVAVIGCLNMVYAVGYMEHSHTQWRFYTFFLFMVGGLMGVAASRDLYSFFTFWEIMSSWSLYCVIVHEEFPEALREGFKYFFFNVLGAAFMFLGVVLLTAGAGSPAFDAVHAALPSMPVGLSATAVGLMVLGLVMKAAQLPFRIDVQMHPATAPTPVSGYISSVLLKSALFGLAKLLLALGGGAVLVQAAGFTDGIGLMQVVAWVGGITIVMAALLAVLQSDLKLVLIYSTVSQLGYMVLAFALGTPLGMAGGLLHLANHVLFKDLLFLVAGALILQTHKHSLDQLGGIGRKMPVTLGVFAIGALSVVGVPPTNGFTSKWIIYHALMQQGEVMLAILSLVGSVLTLAYFAKYLHAAFLGQPSPDIDHVHEAPRVMLVPMLVLAAGCVVTGFFPGLLLAPIATMLTALGLTAPEVAPWGLASGAGAWNATAVAVLATVAAAFGWGTLRLLTRNSRVTTVHTCGVDLGRDVARMNSGSIYGAPVALLRGMTASKER